jgi:hypothetical protein
MPSKESLDHETVLRHPEEIAREKNAKVEHRLEFGEYGFLQFQEGPRKEVGINGLFIADDKEPSVIPALIQHLKNLNSVLPSRETSLAITKLEECNMWLLERKRAREASGTLGTYKPHA